MWTCLLIIFILTFIFATLITSIESAKPKVFVSNGEFGSVTFENKKFSDSMLYIFYFAGITQSCSIGDIRNGKYRKLLDFITDGKQIIRGEIRNRNLVNLIKKGLLKFKVGEGIYDILGTGKNTRLEL